MGKDIGAAVREICAALPDVEERHGIGMADFRVAGKTFATLAINHRGNGRIALWARAPEGAQQHYVASEPAYYFVPPHVGANGWLGIQLDRGNDWTAIAERVQEAFAQVAPAPLRRQLGEPPTIEPPTETIDPEELDPLSAPHAQDVLQRLCAWCATLPETREGQQFGNPAFKAGNKTFLAVQRDRYQRRLTVTVWVGIELQAALTDDPRFTVPDHAGHQGWIALDIEEHFDFDEVQRLALGSYRHVALKRMLRALDEA